MTKQEFLSRLREGLAGLPQEDMEERLSFYGEMIDDRVEDGLSEEAAVEGIGTVDDTVTQIIADTPLSKLVKEKMLPKQKLKIWEIVLLAVGSPLWLSLLVVVFAVALAVYAVLWAVILALWATEAAIGVSALAGIAAGIVFIFRGNSLPGIAVIGAAIACAGLAVFLFFGCKEATKGAFLLFEKLLRLIKKGFIKKEAAI